MKIPTYKQSGRFGASAIPLGLLFGTGAAVTVGWIYQAFIDWVPLIYFNIFATLAFGALVGAFAAIGLHTGKSRNMIVALFVGLLSGAVGEAASFHYAYQRATAAVAEEEGVDAEEIRGEFNHRDYLYARAEAGWSIGRTSSGIPIRGVFVWGFWGIEALLVCGLSAAVAHLGNAGPFCEACGLWPEEQNLPEVPDVDADAIAAAVTADDLSTLLAAPRREGSGRHAAYTVTQCKHCQQKAWVTLKLKWNEVDAKGNKQDEEKSIIENAIVQQSELEALQRLTAVSPT
jgi:hypothetical protein